MISSLAPRTPRKSRTPFPDGTHVCGPRRYIEKMIGTFEQMFGEKPRAYSSLLERNDHPKLDDSQEMEGDDVRKYQSMVGALQWAIALGRFDVLTPTMTMSSFRACPRVAHLDRLKRMYGFLRKHKHGAIRVRAGLPDHSRGPDNEHDWMHTVYGNVKEQIPHDAPELLGKEVVTTMYEDANLYHDMLTG